MDHFRVKRPAGSEAHEAFIQIIQGMCRNADTLHGQMKCGARRSDEMALIQDVSYMDLRHPWFASKP